MKKNEIKIIIEGMPDKGGLIRADAFVYSLDSITKNIKKTDKLISGSGTSSFYLKLVELNYQSPATVIMEAIPINPDVDFREKTIEKFCSVYQAVQDETIAEKEIDYGLIEALNETTQIIGKYLNSIRIITNGYDLNLTIIFKAKVDLALAPEEKSIGYIRGMLEYINIHQDKNLFRIYPDVGPKKVSCHFPQELTEKAIDSIGKFVEVKGEIKYKAISKYPHEIIVEEIEAFPDEKELPSLYELRGIAPDLTGKLSSEQFVRKIRNA